MSLPPPSEIAADLLILGGAGACVYAAWLVDPRLGYALGGLFAISLGILVALKRE